MELKDKIRSIPDFPIKGVLFRDITTLLKDPEGYHELVSTIVNSLRDRRVDHSTFPQGCRNIRTREDSFPCALHRLFHQGIARRIGHYPKRFGHG